MVRLTDKVMLSFYENNDESGSKRYLSVNDLKLSGEINDVVIDHRTDDFYIDMEGEYTDMIITGGISYYNKYEPTRSSPSTGPYVGIDIILMNGEEEAAKIQISNYKYLSK